MSTYQESLTTECECGADISCEVEFGIDAGERESLHCPGTAPSIEGIEVKADEPTCKECGRSTDAAADRLFEELDRDSHRAWELLDGDRIYQDARPYDY